MGDCNFYLLVDLVFDLPFDMSPVAAQDEENAKNYGKTYGYQTLDCVLLILVIHEHQFGVIQGVWVQYPFANVRWVWEPSAYAIEHGFHLELPSECLIVDHNGRVLVFGPKSLIICHFLVNNLVHQYNGLVFFGCQEFLRKKFRDKWLRLALNRGFPVNSNFLMGTLATFEIDCPITFLVHRLLVVPPYMPSFHFLIVLVVYT